MAGDLKEKFGTSNQPVTVALGGLADGSAWQSTVIDNSSNVFTEALLMVKLKSGSSGTASTGYANVYAFATADGGTTYTETAGASSAAITLTVPTNLKLIGVVNIVANSVTYLAGPFSVASAFGYLPEKWGIVIENKSGHALDATDGNHGVWYQGVLAQYT